MKLTGRTILITGGSAGIGLAFALKFLELGNAVIVTGRRQAVLDQVKAKHPKLHTIQSDVADPAQIAALAARVKSDFPKLDVLMNNAGIMLYKNLKSPAADLTGLMAEMNVNVGGVVGTTSALIDVLTSNKGTVINVSSGLAFVPLPAAPIYSATKAAIHSYTQSLRFQLEETGVEVIELMPPAVKTDLASDIAEGGSLTLMTTDELVKQSFASFKAGALEIRPGQAKQLALMRRLAPDRRVSGHRPNPRQAADANRPPPACRHFLRERHAALIAATQDWAWHRTCAHRRRYRRRGNPLQAAGDSQRGAAALLRSPAD